MKRRATGPWLGRRPPERFGERVVVVVTGASRGIGLEVCRRFGALGASVGMIARNPTELADATAEVTGPTCAVAADVSDPAALAQAMAEIGTTLGPVSVLVNNAGHGQWGSVADTDHSVFERAIAVNYLGAVYATDLVLREMLQRGTGNIVNIASVAGRMAAPFEAAYSASKFALVGYSEALAAEVAGSGVSVSVINPGGVDTEFFARRRRPYGPRWPAVVEPQRVAEAVVDAVRHGHHERFIPSLLGGAYRLATICPPARRIGVRRMFAAERRELRRRHR